MFWHYFILKSILNILFSNIKSLYNNNYKKTKVKPNTKYIPKFIFIQLLLLYWFENWIKRHIVLKNRKHETKIHFNINVFHQNYSLTLLRVFFLRQNYSMFSSWYIVCHLQKYSKKLFQVPAISLNSNSS